MMRLVVVWGLLAALGCAESVTSESTSVANLSRTETPVLLLPEPYMRSAAVMAEARWFAIDTTDEGLSVHLHGTHAFVEAPAGALGEPPAPNASVRGNPAYNYVEESVRVLTWMEQGAAYSLDLVCPSEGDARCADESFIVELASQTEPVR